MSRVVPDPNLEPTITLARAAAILGIGLTTIYDAAHRGELPVIKVSRSYRVLTGKFLEQYGLEPSKPQQSDPVAAA